MRKHILVLFACLVTYALQAQNAPINDDCAGALELTDLNDWCSRIDSFTTARSTPSPDSNARCFPATQTSNDIWFSFTAQASFVSIRVNGASSRNPGGTLQQPQVALFSGTCGNLTTLECASDANSRQFAITLGGPLEVGRRYYIRVGARSGRVGSFQLCINNFSRIPAPSGDCQTGVILCDKAPITVPFVSGEGQVRNEINGTNCDRVFSGCRLEEKSSTWYKWTCKDPGSLTFNITPQNPDDDIDFVLYELSGDVKDCGRKKEIRCMASGEIVGRPVAEWRRCTGATGIRSGETDEGESCGCDPGDNNFVSAINMVAGRSYALVIFNFSNTGFGFNVGFGGTGTFLGPTANFQADTIACVGKPHTFTDASTFPGGIKSWTWDFGVDAIPRTAMGAGPHNNVVYQRPGLKIVTLTVETNQGCIVTYTKRIRAICCPDHFTINSSITNLTCATDPGGAINVTVSSPIPPPYRFVWSNGVTTEDIRNVPAGNYTLIVTDAATCVDTSQYTITSPDSLQVEVAIRRPTCNGGRDGEVRITATGGVGRNYQYNWNNQGFSLNSTITQVPVGMFSLAVRDSVGCTRTFTIDVRELELELDPQVNAITPPSCPGFRDGRIDLNISNGLGPYRFDFNDGRGFVDASSIRNIAQGMYRVNVIDANLCRGVFTFDVLDPTPITSNLSKKDITCFGANNGELTVSTRGGASPYQYRWSNTSTDSTLRNLPPGLYQLNTTDAKGCLRTDTITILQPSVLGLRVSGVENVLCFDEKTGVVTVAASGGTPPYSFQRSGSSSPQNSPSFTGLAAGIYTLTVTDANGCQTTVQATVTQPPKVEVIASPDTTIQLGYSVQLNTSPTEPVTFVWTPDDGRISCTDCPNPLVSPFKTTAFVVKGTNAGGCFDTDTVLVTVRIERPVYIPTAFTPNGDGSNDFFNVYPGPAAEAIQRLQIFDRWGNNVYDAANLRIGDDRAGWDGTYREQELNGGVFVYVAEVRFIDGVVKNFEGEVVLVK